MDQALHANDIPLNRMRNKRPKYTTVSKKLLLTRRAFREWRVHPYRENKPESPSCMVRLSSLKSSLFLASGASVLRFIVNAESSV